jgi:hypothetical protein
MSHHGKRPPRLLPWCPPKSRQPPLGLLGLNLLLLHTLRMLVSLLTPPLPPRPHIPPRSTATAHTHMHQPRNNGRASRNPHEDEHLNPDTRSNVQLRGGGNCHLEDDEHDGRDDGSGGGDECSQKGEDGDGKVAPAGVDCQRHDENHEKVHAGSREEEAEHDVGDDADQVEDCVDFVGERDCGGTVSFFYPSCFLPWLFFHYSLVAPDTS